MIDVHVHLEDGPMLGRPRRQINRLLDVPTFTYVDDDAAQADLEFLQGVVGLSDWTLRVRIVRAAKMSGVEQAGEVEWVFSKKMAAINLLDPVDWPASERVVPQNHRLTLLHELCHLHLAWVETIVDVKPTPLHALMEQTVHALSAAFYLLLTDSGR